MRIERLLYQALIDVERLALPPGDASSGTKFEDYLVQQLYLNLQQRGTLRLFKPRYTLREPTFSTVSHQFDIVIRHDQLIAIECKFRGRTGIDDLFAFTGKLADYRERPAGVFVTTATNINDDVFCYAIAHKISIISRMRPPVGYMQDFVKAGCDLSQRLERLETRLKEDISPKHLLVEWQNAIHRFTTEGYK